MEKHANLWTGYFNESVEKANFENSTAYIN